MSVEPGEVICDAIVTALNAATVFAPVTVVAEKPADPLAELTREFPNVQVLLVPTGTAAVKIGRPRFLETHEVELWVIRKIEDEWTRERMSLLVRQIVEFLRGQRMAGFTYSIDETVSKFDLAQLHERQQFLSVTKFMYMGVG